MKEGVKMVYSILFPGSAPEVYCLPENTLYHLSLDRSFIYICPDTVKREYFLKTVSSMPCDAATVLYRQDILRDFQDNDGLIDLLKSLFDRFAALEEGRRKTKHDSIRLKSQGLDSLATARNRLQSSALCLKRALLFVKSIAELLSSADIRSEGLLLLRDGCRKHCGGAAFEELLSLCTRFENFSTAGNLDIRVTLDGDGRITASRWIEHRYVHITDPDIKKKGFPLFRKQDETEYPCERLYIKPQDHYEQLTVAALSEIAAVFAHLSTQLFESYLTVGSELVFYCVALMYTGKLSEKGIGTVFPEIGAAGGTDVRGLYDLFLAMSAPDTGRVVPNDVIIRKDAGGILLFGENGSGKTVFLRSAGTMQLLAQAGLPVPAKSAVISVRRQIVTQFSEAEKEFCQGNDAGRFEQEVRELAAMVDSLKPGALVFLNETFQSTAYDEGAAGLAELLRYLRECGIEWMLVTHLRRLETEFAGGGAEILYTKDNFRISGK